MGLWSPGLFLGGVPKCKGPPRYLGMEEELVTDPESTEPVVNDGPADSDDSPADIVKYGAFIEVLTLLVGLAFIAIGAYVSKTGRDTLGYSFAVTLAVGAGTSFLLVGILLRVQRAIQGRLEVANQVLLQRQLEISQQLDQLGEQIHSLRQGKSEGTDSAYSSPERSEVDESSRKLVLSDWLAAHLLPLLRPLFWIATQLGHSIESFAQLLLTALKWVNRTSVAMVLRWFFRRTVGREAAVLKLQTDRLRIWRARHPRLMKLASAAFGAVIIGLIVAVVLWSVGVVFSAGPFEPSAPVKTKPLNLLGRWTVSPLTVVPSETYNWQTPATTWPSQSWIIRSGGACKPQHICIYQVSGLYQYFETTPSSFGLEKFGDAWAGEFTAYGACVDRPKLVNPYRDLTEVMIRQSSNSEFQISVQVRGQATAAAIAENCYAKVGVGWKGVAVRAKTSKQ